MTAPGPSNSPDNAYAGPSVSELTKELVLEHRRLCGAFETYQTVTNDSIKLLIQESVIFTRPQLADWTGFCRRMADLMTRKHKQIKSWKKGTESKGRE